MNRYRDLFIDFDDTLYDTYGNAMMALHELFDHLHLERYFPAPSVFYDEYWRTNIELWQRYAQGDISRAYLILERFRRPLSLGVGLEATREYCLNASDLFLDLCSVKPGLVAGATELVEHLHSKGYRLHLCSNGFHEVQYRKLRSCGLEWAFSTVILSEDAGFNKPDARYFDYALRTSGAVRSATLMIGDNADTDIRGAHRAGLATAYYNRFPGTPVPPEADYSVESLSDLMALL